MQASRVLTISGDHEFVVGEIDASKGKEDIATGTPAEVEGRGGEGQEDGNKESGGDKSTTPIETNTKRKDPIRMFGILTPQALKMAQADAIKMVEEIVPELVKVDREMLALEIEVRRRRKWLVKAEGLEKSSHIAVGGVLGKGAAIGYES